MTDFLVTFKKNGKNIVTVKVFLAASKGEPFDTVNIFHSAAERVRSRIDRGKVPSNTLEVCDAVVIERPIGTKTEYPDHQITKLIDDCAELQKYTPTRETRVLIFQAGGFMGGMIGTPVEATLDLLSEREFLRVREIFDLLQKPSATLEHADWSGDFGYYVKAGDRNADRRKLKKIFEGGPFSSTPKVVEELQNILAPYSRPDNRQRLNPTGRGKPTGV